jgi:TRAP-type C4-dicarboxylate transport system substrate-binding protein
MPIWVVKALLLARKVRWTRVIAAIGWLVTRGRKYWERLSPDERRELLALMRKSKGRRSNLSKKEMNRVAELFKKIRKKPRGK